MTVFISGTKSSLRVSKSEKIVYLSKAKELKSEIEAAALVECSTLKGENIGKIIQEDVRAVVKEPKSTPSCKIL